MGRKPPGKPRAGLRDRRRLPSEFTYRGAPAWLRKTCYGVVWGIPLVACVGHFLVPHRPRLNLGAGFMNGPEHAAEALYAEASAFVRGQPWWADDGGRFLEAADARTLATADEGGGPKTRRRTPVPSLSRPPSITPAPSQTFAPTDAPTVTFAPTIEEFLRVQYFSQSFSEVLSGMAVTFGSIIFVMFMLKLVLDMAAIEISDLPEYRRVHDKFQSVEAGQNWNYDFVIVTSVKNEDHEIKGAMQRKNTMLRIVSALTNADLETEQYKSRKFDKIFIKNEVKRRLIDGLPDPLNPEEWQIYPRKEGWLYRGIPMHTAIFDTEEQCPYAYYEYMYGQYDDREELETLYHRYPRSSSIFRSVDRVKLIMSIIKFPSSDNGANLLQAKWLVYWAWPWEQPFVRIKDYYGEKVGLYFVFLGHYTTAVIIAAVVGFAFYIVTIVQDPNSPAIPGFCVFMSLWATFFIEFWKRKQSRYAMIDLVVDINSPIDGEEVKYFPPAIYNQRTLTSWAIILTSSTSVICAVVGIFFLKSILAVKNNLLNTRHWNCDHGRGRDCVKNWGIPKLAVDLSASMAGWITSGANAVQIFALESFFNELAVWLNDYECHRTDTTYTDKLTEKIFIFQFINSFTSYLYIAFFKQLQANSITFQPVRPGNYSCVTSCMNELRIQLAAIFLSKVIIANVKDIAVPYVFWNWEQIAEKRRRDLDEMAAAADAEEKEASEEMLGEQHKEERVVREVSPAERELALEEYHVMMGTFGDYRDLIIIYGYTVLFVAAFPLAPLMALSNAEDIGSWADIIELMSYIAVFTNSIIIVYTGEFLDFYPNSHRLIQIDRQNFTEDKLIKQQIDDVIEVDEDGPDNTDDNAPDVTIFDKDDSVVYLDYPGYENYAKEKNLEMREFKKSQSLASTALM
ncbi:intracellular chloride channel [Aureococcus anophagefferens]|nr:intracellular chloride channel [Aureococcus anophagefferens]